MTDLDSRTSMATYDDNGDNGIADEVVVHDPEGRWQSLLDRLNDLSVTKHFDAYADIAWDDPAFALDPTDPRWELTAEGDSLGGTEWYQALPQPTRARLGVEMVASKMKIGLIFESILKRGLLDFAMTLPNNSPEFRYVYHEVIEEAQHSLMFQEFVNRTRSATTPPAWPGTTGYRAAGSSASAGASRHCSSCSSSAAKTRSTTCSGVSCAATARSTRCSSASSAFTSPRRRGTCRSRATTSSGPCRSSAAGSPRSSPSARH